MREPTAARAALWIALAAAGVAVAPLVGQSENPSGLLLSNRSSSIEIEFNFSNPGARSLGLGGAFVGRADDATAAYANPAGLSQIREPELSMESRSWSFPVTIGLASFTGPVPAPAVSIDEEATGISFLSYVVPRGRWTWGLFRHQQADYSIRAREQGIDAEMVTHGAAGAYRFDNGLSFGLTLAHHDLSLESVSPCRTLLESCLPAEIVARGESSEVTGNAGVLWRINPRWSVGAVVRRSPAVRVENFIRAAPGLPVQSLSSSYEFQVPHSFGLGVGLHLTSRIVLDFDYNRVTYGDSLDAVGDTTVSSPLTGNAVGRFELDDADELRLGFEYSFWNTRGAPALRLGVWHEPAHRLRFERVAAPGSLLAADLVILDLLTKRFDGGSDRLHFAAGFGFVLGRHFQLDAAADVSDETETYALSTLVRF